MAGKKVVIVGAGLGGLALAVRLAHHGFDVEVFEKNHQSGGRVFQKKVKKYTIDGGPTFLLMPGEFEELYDYVDEDFPHSLQLLEPSYRLHFWGETIMDVHASLPKMLGEIKRISPGEEKNFLEFLAYEQPKYQKVYENFISKSPETILEIARAGKLADMLQVDGFVSMWEHAGTFFGDEKLRLAFSFQSMYLGQSPLLTPGTYTVVPFVELTQGVWYPADGMYTIIARVEKLARKKKVNIHRGKKVNQILVENNIAKGVELENGQKVLADIVVSNLDLPATYSKLIPPEKRKKYTDAKLSKLEYSCSAFMLFLGVKKTFEQLEHHNVFFSKNYLQNFHELFEEKILPTEPSLYINVPSLTSPKLAPKGKHLLYVLVPVPNNKNKQMDWEKEKNAFAQKIIRQMESYGLTDLEKNIEMREIFTPDDWKKLGGMHFGATFGLSPLFFQSSVFRPQQKSEEFEHLYFVGASTHPGSGMPMVLISARTAAEKIIRKFG